VNKYLEKIAALSESAFKNLAIGGGAALGGITGGTWAYHSTKNYNKAEMAKPKHLRQESESLGLNAAIGTIGGSVVGAQIGDLFVQHRLGKARVEEFGDLFKNNRNHRQYQYQYHQPKQDTIQSLHETLGSGRIKTKDEFKAHYRRQVSKYHPDRYVAGSKEQQAANDTLTKINAARDKFMTHPEGFEKLAHNKFLNRIFSA
jgi:hypothetical protein